MATLSTHVLDTSIGSPAPGVPVALEQDGKVLAHAETDRDGRVRELGAGAPLAPGGYRLVYSVEPYFSGRGVQAFYSIITVQFVIRDDQHYHVPLLLSPFGYSTYRGS